MYILKHAQHSLPRYQHGAAFVSATVLRPYPVLSGSPGAAGKQKKKKIKGDLVDREPHQQLVGNRTAPCLFSPSSSNKHVPSTARGTLFAPHAAFFFYATARFNHPHPSLFFLLQNCGAGWMLWELFFVVRLTPIFILLLLLFVAEALPTSWRVDGARNWICTTINIIITSSAS